MEDLVEYKYYFNFKVVEYSTSKTGKHGHAKASITAIDIFNGKKYEDSIPGSHNCECPNIKRTEYQVLSVNDEGFVSLMNPQGEVRSDLRLPDETEDDINVAKGIESGIEAGKDVFVTVLSAMDIEKIVQVQEK